MQLTCTSPIASITCAIVPSSVTLNGTTTSVAIVVNTFCKGLIPNGGPNDIPNGGPNGFPKDVPTPGGFGTGLGLLLVALVVVRGSVDVQEATALGCFVWIADYFRGGDVGMQQLGEIAER